VSCLVWHSKQTHQYDTAERVERKAPFTYRYDECGRVIEKTVQKNGRRSQTTKFIWNEFDQLIRVELPNNERWRYRYDPFGRRIAKECEQSQTTRYAQHYLWDGNNLIQQQKICADGTALTSEYIYELNSFRPLAQINTASFVVSVPSTLMDKTPITATLGRRANPRHRAGV